MSISKLQPVSLVVGSPVIGAPALIVPLAARRLRIAVQAAIRAYAKSGRMLDAALAYASFGLPVFPLDPRSKVPIPRRDPDPTGEYPDGIPGSGGVYKATCDPLQIIEWWRANPTALIGLPMGERSGVWCLDVDTPEDHADGATAWDTLSAQHEPFNTREHRSATGGPHLIFNWSEAAPIRCSKGDLPSGIEVKGQGGYIAVPPSIRKGRAYTVHNDIDPIDVPKWLIDLILPTRPYYSFDDGGFSDVDLEELADAMQHVPNDDLDWNEWTSFALALFAASGGSEEGFAIFDEWSKTSGKYEGKQKYGRDYTRQRWQEIKGSPPDRTGAGKIFKAAYENGWRGGGRSKPSYPETGYVSSADARRRMDEIVFRFLLEKVGVRGDKAFAQALAALELPQTVWAARVDVGVGKTQITIEVLADYIRRSRVLTAATDLRIRKGPFIYAVDRHRLGKKIEERFTAHGIDARVFRGRMADDPENPGERMCLNEPAVQLAMSYHANISETCCKQGKHECLFKKRCGYWRQIPEAGDQPDVWIVAHDMLFHTQEALGKPAAVIIDERMWQKGIRGIEDESKWSVALDSISNCTALPNDFKTLKALGSLDAFELAQLRYLLAHALRQQEQNGGVERRHLEAKQWPRRCTQAIHLEWKLMPKLQQHPGMSHTQLITLATEQRDLIDSIKHSRRMIKIWEAARAMLAPTANIDVSGHLTLLQDNGQRCVEWKGTDEIKRQFKAPTLMLDATLPDKSILQVYHPTVEVVADLRVAMPPSVHIRQVLGAPTSANKLKNEKHLAEVRRYILQRWIETGRGATLVICQLAAEQWLAQTNLPGSIALAHYNDIAGLDDFRAVRLLILVGRTQPGPSAPETITAALTGRRPPAVGARKDGAFAWYPQVQRGIRLSDGSAIAVRGDQHCDRLVEAVRWQICEAELMQAIGRGRAINRAAETPLDINLLFDTVLPITVDEVVRWKTPSLLAVTAAEGYMPTAPVDMTKLRPELWANEKAAYRTVQQGVPPLPGFVPITYQLKGAKMKQRVAYFDQSIIPDPRAWLEKQLGPLL